MRSLIESRFERDFQRNLVWKKKVIENESIMSNSVITEFSKLINVHHIWNSRLLKVRPESHSLDQLPIEYWERFIKDNYRQTIHFLDHYDLTNKIEYHDEENVKFTIDVENILFHILDHNTHQRALISSEFKLIGITPPSIDIVQYI